jgi:hypothetical protein
VINLFLLFFLYSCSQVSRKSPPHGDLVSVDAALDHIQASYLRGCVEAFKELGVPTSFEHCRDKAEDHQNEVRQIIEQTP